MEYTSVTLYHKRYNKAERDYTWTHTQFPRAYWYGGAGIKLLNNRYVSDDSYTVRIFTQDEIDVQINDVLVLGAHDAPMPSALPECAHQFTVANAIDSRRGSPSVQHWKIGGA